MILTDALRPPWPGDPQAFAFKEWLHLNLFDFESGNVAVVNVSLHGAPLDPRSLAVGLAVVHVPEIGWVGGVETGPRAAAAIERAGIGLRSVALALDASGDVLGQARTLDGAVELRARAQPEARTLDVEIPVPFGSGWIAWRAVPRLHPRGAWTVLGKSVDEERSAAYHDHNWGRWRWGDDVGWEWGTFLTLRGPSFVFAVTTDRAHDLRGPTTFAMDLDGRRRMWSARVMRMEYGGLLPQVDRRLPGALAALHQDRAHPALPRTVSIDVDDGFDRLELLFEAESAIQLITADPSKRGYGFIHELAGRFWYRGIALGRSLEGEGLGIFEHVD